MMLMMMMMMLKMMVMIVMVRVVVVMMVMTFIDLSVLHSLGENPIWDKTLRRRGNQVDVSNCDRSIKVFSVNPPLIFTTYQVSSLICMITLFLKLKFCFADDKRCVKFYVIKLFFFNSGTPTNPPAQPTPSEFMKLFVMRHINIIFLFC